MPSHSSTDPPAAVLHSFGFAAALCRELPGGRMNRHWRVETATASFVLRRYNALRSRESALWEHALLDRASARGWSVAPALRSRSGETLVDHADGLWSAHPFLPGAPGPTGDPAAWHTYGRLLARLHETLAGAPALEQRPGAGQAWELDPIAGPAGFDGLLSCFGADYPDLARAVGEVRAHNLEHLAQLRAADLPVSPVHGDFAPWNLLFTAGTLSGVLDFDQARLDAPVADIAPLLMPFMPLDAEFATALLRGYQSVRPLSDHEWAVLPALVRASLLAWVAFLLASWAHGAGEQALNVIRRTTLVRIPAFDDFAPQLEAIRRAAEPDSPYA